MKYILSNDFHQKSNSKLVAFCDELSRFYSWEIHETLMMIREWIRSWISGIGIFFPLWRRYILELVWEWGFYLRVFGLFVLWCWIHLCLVFFLIGITIFPKRRDFQHRKTFTCRLLRRFVQKVWWLHLYTLLSSQ